MKEVKKVVLIGASGFVGSALLNETLNRGFEVTADRKSTRLNSSHNA